MDAPTALESKLERLTNRLLCAAADADVGRWRVKLLLLAITLGQRGRSAHADLDDEINSLHSAAFPRPETATSLTGGLLSIRCWSRGQIKCDLRVSRAMKRLPGKISSWGKTVRVASFAVLLSLVRLWVRVRSLVAVQTGSLAYGRGQWL